MAAVGEAAVGEADVGFDDHTRVGQPETAAESETGPGHHESDSRRFPPMQGPSEVRPFDGRASNVHPFDMRGDVSSQALPVEATAARAERAANVVALSPRREGGRAFGAVMTALAASLAGVIALQAYRPDLLPSALRVKPEVQIVEAKAPPAQAAPAQMVALLQQDGQSPAFILTVDTATKNFTVRKVNAAAESGKSYELWLVSDKLQKPRSLGLIGNSDFTIRPTLASYDTDTINKATYAVTLEPEGGSTTGGPTGPLVYKGNLIESVPPGADRIAPR